MRIERRGLDVWRCGVCWEELTDFVFDYILLTQPVSCILVSSVDVIWEGEGKWESQSRSTH